MNTPLNPPITNIATNAMACSIGTWKWMFPSHIVPSQLNTLIADGTEINSVETMNAVPMVGFIPLMNMWWPHTPQPRKPMAMIASTMDVSGMNPTMGTAFMVSTLLISVPSAIKVFNWLGTM